MKKILFLILLFWVLGCKDESKKIIHTDKDVDRDEIISEEVNEEPEAEDKKESVEIENENPLVDDDEGLDPIPDETDEEIQGKDDTDSPDETDSDSDSEAISCPDLKKAKFPYYDKDGKIHFCRECDVPKADDPKCVRNLWDEVNKRYAKAYPKRDCYPYPCEMAGLKPGTHEDDLWTPLTECDLCINPKMTGVAWLSGEPHHKHFGFNGGKIGFMMNTDISSTDKIYKYSTDHRVFEYDIERKRYRIIMPSHVNNISYYKGNAFSLIDDYSKIHDEESFFNSVHNRFLIYYDQNKGYDVVYNKPVRFVAYSSYMNEKWVYAIIQEKDESPYMMSYAKIGEWKWTSLGNGVDYFVSFGGDYMGTNDQNGNGYICDLSKYPKSYGDCKKINREGESVDNIEFDQENHSTFVYRSRKSDSDQILVVAMIEKQGENIDFTYKEIPIDPSSEDVYTFAPEGLSGDLIWYREMRSIPDSSNPDSRICYYKISEKKQFCSRHPTGRNISNHGASILSGDYIAWQSLTGPNLSYRDLKCYCKLHPEICPLENSKKK